MNDELPYVPGSEPLTLRQHEQFVRENHSRIEGETDEHFNERVEKRLIRLREDFERKSKKGTLYLMNATAHRERAAELEKFSHEEDHEEKRICLFQAACVHLHHARRLEAEAAEKEADAL